MQTTQLHVTNTTSKAERSKAVVLVPVELLDSFTPVFVHRDITVAADFFELEKVQSLHENRQGAIGSDVFEIDKPSLFVKRANFSIGVAVRAALTIFDPNISDAFLNKRQHISLKCSFDCFFLTQPVDFVINSMVDSIVQRQNFD